MGSVNVLLHSYLNLFWILFHCCSKIWWYLMFVYLFLKTVSMFLTKSLYVCSQQENIEMYWLTPSFLPLSQLYFFITRPPFHTVHKCCTILGVWVVFPTCRHASRTYRFQSDNLWSLGEQCGGGNEEDPTDYSELLLHCHGESRSR